MKKIIFTLFSMILFGSLSNVSAQTNVSGGIYSSTTWTLNNSPYIVTDTIVVFPGVTLTIQPGVVVKFDDGKYMEIRNATLNAIGTITDSITFTSNSNTPTPGIYQGINCTNNLDTINLNYCNFRFAATSINEAGNNQYNIIKNSTFELNTNGFWGYFGIIDSCAFLNNTGGGCGFEFGKISHTSFINSGAALWLYLDTASYCNFSNNSITVSIIDCSIQNCNISSSYVGIYVDDDGTTGNSTIDNCIINNNVYGVEFNPDINGGGDNTTIKNSIIDSNSYCGILMGNSNFDSVVNCQIKYNYMGITDSSQQPQWTTIIQNQIENNTIGLNLWYNTSNFYCNKICNNTTFNVVYNQLSGSNINAENNYWCFTDSATIRTTIYDGYNNIALGLVVITPLDTQSCYLTGCNLQLVTTSTPTVCDTCHTGTASVTVNNGHAPFTYTWNTAPIQMTQTATNLGVGTYTVCVVDANGCTACQSVYVDSASCAGYSVSVQGTNASCISCADGSATVTATGGATPYSYTWYTAPFQYTQTATGLLPGTYHVCVVDAYGCVVCDSVNVGGNCSADFALYPDTAIMHHYMAVNLASGIAPITYDWNWGDNSAHDTIPYPAHTYPNSGNYTMCLNITDAVGCQNSVCHTMYLLHPKNLTPVTVNVVATLTGINTPNVSNSEFFIYPNPNDGKFTLKELGIRNYELGIYDVMGREVYKTSISGTESKSIDVSELNNGIYYYRIANDKEIFRGRFVKE